MATFTSADLRGDEGEKTATCPKWLQNILDEPELLQEVSSILENINSRKRALESLRINTTKRISNSGKTTWIDESYNYADLPPNFQKKAHKLLSNNTDLVPDTQVPKAFVDMLAKNALVQDMRKMAKTNAIRNIHMNEELAFESYPVMNIRNSLTKASIYKSPKQNRRQGSEYYVDFIDGKPAFIRISNHWGSFTTNIYEGTADAEKYFPNYDPDKINSLFRDPYGRIGYKPHNWTLSGADMRVDGKYKNISQAGILWLDGLYADDSLRAKLPRDDEAEDSEEESSLHIPHF